MTTLVTPQPAARLGPLGTVVDIARVALFVVAIGVFLTAPPSLPWVLAVVALTNVIFLAARAWMADAPAPIGLLMVNGLTVTLVIAFVAVTAIHP